MKFLFGLFVLVFPVSADAAVIINEIAWMGSAASANHEWIELYNDGGDSVSLDGWSLKDGMNLEIPLQGSINAGQYAVLERTSDDTAVGTAFLIYTGALSNTGATLSLYRADASLEDQVAGGENWQNIGGDNTTKETAHYTSSGWVTAVATPGAPVGEIIKEEEQEKENEEENENTQTTSPAKKSSGGGVKAVALTQKSSELSLTIESPPMAYVNQPIRFAVVPSGPGDVIINSLKYQWNFGDLSTSSFKEVTHSFTDAGAYVVIVEGTFAKHKKTARTTVTVLPVTFQLSEKSNGDILLHNNAKYEVDLSGYRIKSNEKFTFPPRTFILPNATIVIKKEKIQSTPLGSVKLYDQAGALVATLQRGGNVQLSHQTPVTPILKTTQTAYVESSQTPVISAEKSNFSFSPEVAVSSGTKPLVGATSIEDIPPMENQEASVVTSGASIPKNTLPYLFLCGVLALGVFTVFSSRIGTRV